MSSDQERPQERPGGEFLPTTLRTWIEEMLDQGDQGRLKVNRHVMEIYYLPLQVYYRGSSWRWLGESEEVVGEFFRDRLERPGFFKGWQERESKLRYWFLGAFQFFLKERARKLRRDKHAPLEDEQVESGEDPRAEIDRAFARSIVNEACRRTKALCEAQGLGEHWQTLLSHVEDGKSYPELAADMQVSEERTKRMARTARAKFRNTLIDLLNQDGVGKKDSEHEIQHLMEILET